MPAAQPAPGEPDALGELLEAVRLAPRNIALRQALGDAFLAAAQPARAESTFRDALALAPDRLSLKVGLTEAFLAQRKFNHALALLESLTQSPDAPAPILALQARVLLASGDPGAALESYRRALERDPASAEPELSARLGLAAFHPGSLLPDDPDDANPDPGPDTDAIQEPPEPSILGGPWSDPGSDQAPLPLFERPPIRFVDVGGMDRLKDEIRLKIIHPIAHAALFQTYGKPVGGGILMYGPPGCGKTHLARATAGEIQATFLSIGIHDVLEMWLGRSERNLHELFDNARRRRPCVLFFDEIDALGGTRHDLRHHGGRQLVNQFLAELDGLPTSNEGVLVLAATNAPWHVDPAFRRPGRFDRILFVPPPDPAARVAILRLLLAGKPVADLALDAVARRTEHFSGADLKSLVDVAVEARLREALQSGVPRPISQGDLLAAAASLKPSTREWLASARNYALYANQGGLYDDVAAYLKMT